jgi:hypothetical protein
MEQVPRAPSHTGRLADFFVALFRVLFADLAMASLSTKGALMVSVSEQSIENGDDQNGDFRSTQRRDGQRRDSNDIEKRTDFRSLQTMLGILIPWLYTGQALVQW